MVGVAGLVTDPDMIILPDNVVFPSSVLLPICVVEPDIFNDPVINTSCRNGKTYDAVSAVVMLPEKYEAVLAFKADNAYEAVPCKDPVIPPVTTRLDKLASEPDVITLRQLGIW
jgi:hypothetical protein